MSKPFIAAADKNKKPIAAVLRRHFEDVVRVLEIGAGTGQHAVHFAADLPSLMWQPSDLPALLPGIAAWIEDSGLANVLTPIALDVRVQPWPEVDADAVYTSNTVHFMAWEAVVAMFEGVGRLLRAGGRFALYGPFNYGGRPATHGNRQLDLWLKAHDASLGVRDFGAIERLAADNGLGLVEDCCLPVHNHVLVFAHG